MGDCNDDYATPMPLDSPSNGVVSTDGEKLLSQAGENEARCKVPARDRNPIIGLGLGSDGGVKRSKGQCAQGEKQSSSSGTPPRATSRAASSCDLSGSNEDGRNQIRLSHENLGSPFGTDPPRDSPDATGDQAGQNEARCKVPARERNPITGLGLGTDGVFMRLKGQRAARESNPVTGEGYTLNNKSESLHPKNGSPKNNNQNLPGGNSRGQGGHPHGHQ